MTRSTHKDYSHVVKCKSSHLYFVHVEDTWNDNCKLHLSLDRIMSCNKHLSCLVWHQTNCRKQENNENMQTEFGISFQTTTLVLSQKSLVHMLTAITMKSTSLVKQCNNNWSVIIDWMQDIVWYWMVCVCECTSFLVLLLLFYLKIYLEPFCSENTIQ